MANVNMPNGFAPVRMMDGSPWNGAVNYYCVLAANTNEIHIGDMVTTIGNAGGDALGFPTVTLASAGAASRGVVVAIGTNQSGGPYINPNDLTKIFRPTGAQPVNYYCAVVDDPRVIFEIQEAGVGSPLTTAAVSRNVNLNAGTRPVGTGVQLSPMYLDNNTVAGTATLNLKIISAVQRMDNTPFTQYQKWDVLINNHEFSAGTASS